MYSIPAINEVFNSSLNLSRNHVVESSDDSTFDFLMVADELGFNAPIDELNNVLESDSPHLGMLTIRTKLIEEYASQFKFTLRCTPFHSKLKRALQTDFTPLRFGSSFLLALENLGFNEFPECQEEIELAKCASDYCINIDDNLKRLSGVMDYATDKTNIVVEISSTDEMSGIGVSATAFTHYDFTSFDNITDRSITDVVYKILAILCRHADVQFVTEDYEEAFTLDHEVEESIKSYMKSSGLNAFDDLRTHIEAPEAFEDFVECIECVDYTCDDISSLLEFFEYKSKKPSFLPKDFFENLAQHQDQLINQTQLHLNADENWGGTFRDWIYEAISYIQESASIVKASLSGDLDYLESESYDIYYASTLTTHQSESIVVESCESAAYNCGAFVETVFDASTPLQSQAAIANILTIIKSRSILAKGSEL